MLTQTQPSICTLCYQPIETPSRVTQVGCSCTPTYHTNCILRWNDWNPDRCPSCEEPVEFQIEASQSTLCKRQLVILYMIVFIIVLCSVLIWYFTVLQ